jgi:hypothetical protein
MLSVLVAAFDPVSMGLGMEVETLSQLLLKHRFIFSTDYCSKMCSLSFLLIPGQWQHIFGRQEQRADWDSSFMISKGYYSFVLSD